VSCEGRHHDWDETQTPPVCKKCGDPKKSPGRPKGSKTKKVAGAVVAGRLAATLGVTAPPPRSETPNMEPAPPPGAGGGRALADPAGSAAGAKTPAAGSAASPGAPTVAPDAEKADSGRSAPPLKPKGWCKSAGKKLARLFDVTVDWAYEELGNREANDADEEDIKEMGEGIGEQLAVWFPDAELTPWKKIIVAGACIVAEKGIGAKKLPPKPKPGDAIAAARPAPVAPPPGKVLTLAAPFPPPPPTPPSPAAVPAADSTRAETNPQPSII